MPCFKPLTGWRLSDGGVKIGLQPPEGSWMARECLRIPCGECYGCRMEYAGVWSMRCQHEASCWVGHNAFVTLTYDDDNLAWHRGLVLEDAQAFTRGLRRRVEGALALGSGKRPIRYFGAGEYGSRTRRPHWHFILFNVRLSDLGTDPERQAESTVLREVWPHGGNLVSGFSPGRAAYVAGYAAKKVRGKLAERHYEVMNPETGEIVMRRPESCVMSHRPGIGYYWFKRFAEDLKRGYVEEAGGVRKKIPRYYLEKLLASDPEFAAAQEVRREKFLAKMDSFNETPERLAVREQCARSRKENGARERAF